MTDASQAVAESRVDAAAFQRAADFVERFTAAHASRRPEALGDLFHPECEVDYPTVDGLIDRDGVVEFWQGARAMMPDLDVRTMTWAAAGDDVFIEWLARGTLNGVALEWRGADRFTLHGEHAVSEGNYWDSHPLREAMANGATAG